MYKKKSNKPLYIAIAVAVILIVLLAVMQTVLSKKSGQNHVAETETESEVVTETETETPVHNILLYKSSSGTIEFDASWLVSDSDSDSVLEVEENILVTMLITPSDGKALESVDVLDYDMQTVSSVVRSVSGTEDGSGEMRLSFVMPDRDVFINFNFVDIAVETEALADVAETESESETEEASPYGLSLHGLTDEILSSYNGIFDEQKFLQSLGDALQIDSDESEYRMVTDVYFGDGISSEESDTPKVSYYIYFNGYETWSVLSTYYVTEDSYVFTETPAAAETETEEENITTSSSSGVDTATTSSNESSDGSGTGGSTGSSSGTGSAGSTGSTGTSTTTTSLDILSVSTVFLSFVGDEDAFYQSVFDYILGKGYTGSITGTMSSYEINPENQTATIQIRLSSGGMITGTYNKSANTYSFSGL
ncbi:MAG: hypothetical protein LUG93_13745 [Lachnospiraceae bacterium]|nr:hypothetical protein [Lachnospiraceae bacterium]